MIGTLTGGSAAGRVARGIAWVVLATAIAVGAMRVAGTGENGRAEPVVTAAALELFTDEIERLGAEGGQVVAEGMQPGIADIAGSALPDPVLQRMAEGWLASMQEVRREVSALTAPGELSLVLVRFDWALSAYVETGETLLAATKVSGAERDALLDDATALGREADRLYNDALDALAAATRLIESRS